MTTLQRALSRTVLLAGVLVGCGSTHQAATDAATGSSDPTAGDLLGTFQAEVVAPADDDGAMTAGYTTILGKVYDGVQPETVIWTPQLTEGGCVLSTPTVPFCSTSCGGSAACVGSDTCQAYPTSESVGTVHVTGVQTTGGSAAFDLTSVENSYEPDGSTALAYPGWAEGDAIAMTASGSPFTGAFTLSARGVAQLQLGQTSVAMSSGQPLSLTWTPPGISGLSSIHVQLDISHHGGSKGRVLCDVDDTGSLDIGSDMVDELLALGAAGYPTVIVERNATGDAAAGSGHVELIVTSQAEIPVEVPGITSCTSDADCTSPETCQSNLTCE